MLHELGKLSFECIDWAAVKPTTRAGETGVATWREFTAGSVRCRRVDYSSGYFADHWCSRGHVLFVLSGELVVELQDGRSFTLVPGNMYCVGDDMEPHRSHTDVGAELFIVD